MRMLRRHLLCTAAIVATPALAQESPIPLGRVVFGTGEPTVAIDTPQAVTVIDQEDIDQYQATTTAELLDEVPGTQAIGSERVGGLSFNIRGIGELQAADESRIIVTVDGASKFYEQYRMGSFFSDPELYRRVEVLRGPASSTLYGAGAIGGVVAFETKDPADFLRDGNDNAVRLRFGYDSNGDGVLGSVLYAGRMMESLSFLGSLNYRAGDDYEDGDGTVVPGSEFDSLSGLLKGVYDFPDDSGRRLTFSYEAWSSELDDAAYSQTGTLDSFGTADRDIFDRTAVLRYEDPGLGNPWLDLDVVLSHSHTQVEQSDASAPIPSLLFADSEYAYRTTSLKVENTVESSGAGFENYLTFGVQLSDQERIAQTDTGDIGFHPEGRDRRAGFYVQDEFIVGDLTLIPGVRIDSSHLEPSSSIPGAEEADYTAVSPKIAALYELSDEWGVFGSLARTERVPTLDELFSSASGEPPSLALDPEVSESVEFGVSYERVGVFGADDVLALKGTAFHYDIEDLIERSSGMGTPYYVNVGQAEIQGFELEGSYSSERAFARLAYSDIDGEDIESGETLTSAPAPTLAVTLGGKLPEYGIDYGWRGTFVDEITYPGDEDFEAYSTHDFFVGWRPQDGPMEGFEVRASVENAFDETYRNSLAGDNGRGRTYKLTLTRLFNF